MRVLPHSLKCWLLVIAVESLFFAFNVTPRSWSSDVIEPWCANIIESARTIRGWPYSVQVEYESGFIGAIEMLPWDVERRHRVFFPIGMVLNVLVGLAIIPIVSTVWVRVATTLGRGPLSQRTRKGREV